MSGFVRCEQCEFLEDKINEQTTKISEIVNILEPIEIPGVVDQEIYVPLAQSSEMIPIKLPVEPTKKEESDYVQSTILALNQKIKLLQLLEQEKQEFSKLLAESLKSAKDISVSAEETYNQLKQDDQLHQKAIEEISNEIKNFIKLKGQEIEKVNETDNQIFELTEKKSELQQSCQDLENDLKQNETVKKAIINTQTELENVEKERYEVFKKILVSAQEFREETKTLDTEAKGIEEENRKLRDKITEITQVLEQENKKKHELTIKKLLQMSTLQKIKGVKLLEEEQKNYSLRYQEISKNYQSSIDVMKQDLQHSLLSYEKLIQRLHNHHSDIKNSISEVQNQIKVTENRVAIQDEIIEGKNYLEYTSQNHVLHEKIKEHEEKLLETVEYSKDDRLSKYIDQLCTKLLNFSDLFLLQAYKINVAYKASENMNQIIEKTEREIKELQKEATDLQKYAKVYVLDEEDNVDKAVSNSLRELGRPLSIGIVRISPGIYLCGEEKVKISFVNNKLKVSGEGFDKDLVEYLNIVDKENS